MGYENSKKGLWIMKDPRGKFFDIHEDATGSCARMLYLYVCARSADTKSMPRHLNHEAGWPSILIPPSCDDYVPLPPRCVLEYPSETVNALGMKPSSYNSMKLRKAALALADHSLMRVIKTSNPDRATLYQLLFDDDLDTEVTSAVDRWVNHSIDFSVCDQDALNDKPSTWHLELNPSWKMYRKLLHSADSEMPDPLELRRSVVFAPWRDSLK